ncbi:hypothetical protein FZC75_04020 [Sutcliffiella horikoshii]|uniref:Uncharacterized protein n=1 Tax=Sutcliffiella horikoshii TaxID=79883 RepID=A0A5D4THG1_9BACI|nr:hypothetical protein FZC75_04020 [Sutcliffiella horikoshii]
MIGAKGVDSCGGVAALLRPRNEVRRLKVAPRKAKPFAEINSGVSYDHACRDFRSTSFLSFLR